MLKEKIHAELTKVSAMDREKKIEYFKTYYLKTCVILLICLVLFIWFIMDTVFQKEGVCNGCVYQVEITDEEKQQLSEGYLDYYAYNKHRYSAAVATDNMFEGTAQQMDANTHEMALFAQIAAGEIQYLILDKDTLELMSNGGIYLTLEEALPETQVQMLSDMAVALYDPVLDVEAPTAIDLKKFGFFGENVPEAYLVFTVGQVEEDFPQRFITYLEYIRQNNN